MDGFDREHVRFVVRGLLEGTITPFLGAGANLCGRPRGYSWQFGDPYYPSGAELSLYLAEYFGYEGESPSDLMAVATYAEVLWGRDRLYRALRRVFAHPKVLPTALHEFLAGYPGAIRDRGLDSPPPLIVTTNYDLVLEHALALREEYVDLVAYVAQGEGAGRVRHYRPHDEAVLIADPSTYDGIGFDERTVILKIHGTFDPSYAERDSYVITENQYIDYLTTDIWDEIPAQVIDRLKRTHFLFLGYAMRDWNLLVVLKRLGLMPPALKGWAIQLHQSELDKKRWSQRGIESFDVPLEEYVDTLATELASLPSA